MIADPDYPTDASMQAALSCGAIAANEAVFDMDAHVAAVQAARAAKRRAGPSAG